VRQLQRRSRDQRQVDNIQESLLGLGDRITRLSLALYRVAPDQPLGQVMDAELSDGGPIAFRRGGGHGVDDVRDLLDHAVIRQGAVERDISGPRRSQIRHRLVGIQVRGELADPYALLDPHNEILPGQASERLGRGDGR